MKRTLLILATVIIFSFVTKAQINMISNGKVMIGSSTATPITPLHVLGDVYIPLNQSYWIGSTPGTDIGTRLRMHNCGTDAFIDYYRNLYIRYGATMSNYDGVVMYSNGHMSIGYAREIYYYNPPESALQVNGTVSVDGVVKSYGSVLYSDIRLKKNVENLNNIKSKLIGLKGVKYDYISDIPLPQNNSNQLSKPSDKGNAIKDTMNLVAPATKKLSSEVTSRKHFGFVAQDLKKIFPELVYEEGDGTLSIDYVGIIPMLVEALKEQDSIMTIQAAQIKELQKLAKNGSLKSAQLSSLIRVC